MTRPEHLTTDSIRGTTKTDLNQKRMSLATIFKGAFFSMLIIVSLANSMVIYLFVDFQSILSKLSDFVLPEVTLSGQTFNKVNELSYLTARLASSPTQAFRHIAYQDIKNKVKEITDLDQVKNSDPYLNNQLKAIIEEFDGLNHLITKRIQFHRQVQHHEKAMYKIYSETLGFSSNKNLITNNPKNITWLLSFTEAITLASKALAMSRLNQVKQISIQLENKFKFLEENHNNVQFSKNINAKTLTSKLKTILISKNGLLAARIQELRSIGQATGRNNFMHNLIGDYARQVQFYSYELNETTINQTEATAERVKKQFDIIILITIFSIAFLITAVYFLQRKIIKRLLKLNCNVESRLDGESSDLNIDGNDEISDIAHSFDYLVEEIEKQKQKLQELSLTDPLTEIANRRHLDNRLMSELKSSQRRQLPISILMMDVDSFKSFNDHYGHIAGDDCLKKITNALKNCMQRESDFIARFGGEEFVLILPDTTVEGAKLMAKNILNAVYSLKIPHDLSTSKPYVTLSIGITIFRPQQNSINGEALLKQADDALFRAKEQGKNCFVMHRETAIST